jgi:hypothetical protein
MTLRSFLKCLFLAIFAAMVWINIKAALTISLFGAWDNFAANPWAVATLWDAYSGFTIFFCWVCYKERSMAARMIWFVLVMGLGNIATSTYLLIQIFRLKEDEPLEHLVRRTA